MNVNGNNASSTNAEALQYRAVYNYGSVGKQPTVKTVHN